MSTSLSWVPNEDPQTLFSEKCWLQSVLVGAVAYGIIVSLYVLTFELLVRGKNRVEFKRRLPLLIYITALLLLCTLSMCALAAYTQMVFIDNRDYPGGPDGYENKMYIVPPSISDNAASTLTGWLCDALLVWRFKVIYQMCHDPLWIVMFFPCLMFAGSVAMGTGFLIQISTPRPWVILRGINFTMPYLSLSPILNVTLTIAIIVRLLILRYRIVSVMGPGYGTHYTLSATMIIESAAPHSAALITFFVLFEIGNPVAQVLLESLNQIQAIATLLILFRVAQGRDWKETATHVMTARRSELGEIRFASESALRGTSPTLADPEETLY